MYNTLIKLLTWKKVNRGVTLTICWIRAACITTES